MTPGDVGLIGKASPEADFTVLRPARGSDAEVEARVRGGLQMHIAAGAAASAFLFAHSGQWWLCRAEKEAGADAAGRPRSAIFFVRLTARGATASLVGAVGRAARESFVEEMDAAEWLGAPPEPEATPAARRALIALLLGAEVAVVPTASEAAWTASEWGGEDLAFMAGTGRIPWQTSLGRLLVISQAAWMPLMAVKDVLAAIGGRDIPNMAGLHAIGTAEGCRRLLSAWASGTKLAPDAFSEAELTWLLSAGLERGALLAAATPELRRRWLHDGRLTPDEAMVHRADWGESERGCLARVLREAPGGLAVFMECANPGVEGIAAFLGPEDAAVFAWFCAGCEGAVPGDAAARLDRLAGAGALRHAGLAPLSRACASCQTPAIERLWMAAMAAAGMAPAVARALAGEAPLGDLPAGLPAPPPSPDWLAAVPASVLFEQGHWACRDRHWRAWWTEALRQHPGGAALAPSAAAEYSEPALAWLTGTVRDGELPAGSALRTLARWRVSPLPPALQEAIAVLEACGLEDAPLWAAVMERRGSLVGCAPSPRGREALRQLTRAGLVDAGFVVEDVERGAPAAWLRSLACQAGIALLEAPAIPPSGPPCDWDSALTPLLSARIGRAEFWVRWRDTGISAGLSEWLTSTLSGWPGGALAKAVHAALLGEARLGLDALRVAGGALGRAVRVEQAALWASAPPAERRRAFALLRSGWSRCSPVDWLEARLDCWGFQTAPSPTWPCRELAALLPWLNPVWVIQAVMSRRDGCPQEDVLLERLVEQLGRLGYPASPPPPDWAALARPHWVRRLAELPGWEWWARPAQAPEEERT